MGSILWRVLVAVVAVLVTFALLGPIGRVFGLPISGDVLTIVKLCVGGIAVLYILRGPTTPWRR